MTRAMGTLRAPMGSCVVYLWALLTLIQRITSSSPNVLYTRTDPDAAFQNPMPHTGSIQLQQCAQKLLRISLNYRANVRLSSWYQTHILRELFIGLLYLERVLIGLKGGLLGANECRSTI